MFWKFHLTSSGLDTLLSKEEYSRVCLSTKETQAEDISVVGFAQDVTLKEVLDEEDVLQECKTQNSKLIEFLSKDEVLPQLLELAITVPSEDSDLKTQFKYPNLACEVICSDIDDVVNKLVNEKELLDRLWGFLDAAPPINPLIASFFAKIVGTVLMKRAPEVIDSLGSNDVVNKLLLHLEVSAIMEVFVKLMSSLDSSEMRMKIENLLEEQDLVRKLVKRLGPNYPHEVHCNASNLLSELVRMGRETPSQFSEQPDIPTNLNNCVDKAEVLSDLIDTILSHGDSPNAESSLVNGMDVLLSLIEVKRPMPEGLEELFTPVSAERMAQGVQMTLEALAPRLKDFHTLLLDPPPQSAMLSTVGTLDPPLGRVRLHVAWLLSAAIGTNIPQIYNELADLGTINVLLDLFFNYQWNNFLHTYVEQCINSILSSDVGGEDSNSKNPLVNNLFCDCSLISRIVTAWEENESQQTNPGGQRRGYMGHLTRIANSVTGNLDKGPNTDLLQSLFNELPDDLRTKWRELVEGSLHEWNMKNATQIQFTSPMLHSSSEDDDDGNFKSVSILQYENSLQQAFSNYQVQQMSNEFIESFGHNEEDLDQLGKTDNPFDEIGNVDFCINANDETPDAQLFEAVCNEKIHRFDDSNEEDVWEEKELKFSPKATMKRRQAESNSDESEESSDEASSSSDEEPVFSDEKKYDTTNKEEKKDTVEAMEVEEWTASFETEGVAMDTFDAAAVGWVNPDATAAVVIEDETGFADFTDISKFACGDNDASKTGPDSPIAMDEDSNDAMKDGAGQGSSSKAEGKDDKTEEDVDRIETKSTCESDSTSVDTKPSKDESDLKGKNETSENDPKSKLEKETEKGVKVDVFDSDSMQVTSQVVGGFVVIDASASEDKEMPETITNLATQTEAQISTQEDTVLEKEALSRPKGGVSVVTVSSRQVININSDGKVESQRSPRLPRKSRSPTRAKSSSPTEKLVLKKQEEETASGNKLLTPDSILIDSKQQTRETLETENGPVLDAEGEQDPSCESVGPSQSQNISNSES